VSEVLISTATLAQLVEELAKRLNKNGGREEPPERWCDDCVHFRPMANPPHYHNPCDKGHQMEFYVPQDGDGPETFGYFREVCVDRGDRPEPPPPPPPLTWDHPDYRQKPPPRGRGPKKAAAK
jgi:hypothetical protein